ncbi:MAG TPA: PqqD family protein [Solirubrobacteraceae bacterium]|jgi:hypothetical protein|nr:PqqD family protein [Solirubrobacteraceae bacterium]
MHPHGSLPRARQDGLLVETVGEELLLYDQDSHTAHCLSPIAASVWRHCDGEHDLTELTQLAEASENLVADALHELREKDLLDSEPALMQSTVPGVSRREAIGRAAGYAAAAAAGSLIVSVTAATPAMASSGEELAGCTSDGEPDHTCCICKNNMCVNGPVDEAKCQAACAAKGSSERSFTEKAFCS